jgi:hypothetical protein
MYASGGQIGNLIFYEHRVLIGIRGIGYGESADTTSAATRIAE